MNRKPRCRTSAPGPGSRGPTQGGEQTSPHRRALIILTCHVGRLSPRCVPHPRTPQGRRRFPSKMAHPSGGVPEFFLFTPRGAGGDFDHREGEPRPGHGPIGTPPLPSDAGLRTQAPLCFTPAARERGRRARLAPCRIPQSRTPHGTPPDLSSRGPDPGADPPLPPASDSRA
ncbi:hypothetical protein NDU88_006782 [Pleurodeles waltl]|uniref:Uncharacterized protein n=1 Tax=Pleurodeles waltl TaxID=8319 RepID=A0AAV7UQN0_PLEWA|nr:hypothetical protein NDU88_006782 [Pleurodeles waltl]